MNQDLGIKLQAYLDGELSGQDRVQFEAELARNSELQALRRELEMVSGMLREADPVRTVPASGDFYFSQIRRRIEQAEGETREPRPSINLADWLRRALLPLGGVAVALLMFMTTVRTGITPGFTSAHEETEALLEETGAMTFRSDSQSVTVVWLYDKELASASAFEFE
ncbi:MAG: hypothetical protein FJ405_01730 [Verrucomicrobia bacterium]|nr:hypothetical protein [Verrucomicrobiota bacterium]